MRFFLDNCISPYIADGLRSLATLQKYEIVHLREKFDGDADDVDWIPALAADGDWVIVSGDPRISRSPPEQQAWYESGLTAFFFASGFTEKRFWKQAEIVVRWWPRLVLQARECKQGSGFIMPNEGKKFRSIYEPD